MKKELLFSGIGGQGVITLGETLCDAAIKAGYNVTFVPFYGQEKRGGRTMCNIVISDGIESPIISEADVMLIFDERSLGDYQDLVSPDGTLIINSSMVSLEAKVPASVDVRRIPFNDVAVQAGNPKTANVVALGYVAKLKIVDRWLSLDEETGRELFRRLVSEVKGTFRGVHYDDKQ